ncbi:trichohyalin-like [Branchiostoma lanceolatum]|uniref:trichohyalin-like n=1 Tax=Branchiostoma lanceolatum TaxID=7740 RepID=UPI0034515BFB
MSLNGGWSQPNTALSPESFNPMMLQKELMHAWEEEKPQPGMSVAELRRRFEMSNDNQNASERVTRTPTRAQEEPQNRRQEYVQRRPVPAPREYATPEREEYRQQEYAQPNRYNYTQEQQYSQAPRDRYPQREYIQPERDTYHQKENIMPRPIARPASASPKQVDSPQSQIIVPSPKSLSARKKAISQQKEKVPRKQVRSIYSTIQQDLYHQQEFEQQRGPASSVPARQHIPEPTLSSTQRHSSWSGLLDDDQEAYNRQSDKVPPPPPRRKTPVGYAYQRPYSYHSSAHNEDSNLGFVKQPEEYRTDKKMRQEQPAERGDRDEVTQDAYADQIRKMMKKTPVQYSPIRPSKPSTEKRLVGPSDEDIFKYAKAQEPLHVRRSPQAKLQAEGIYEYKRVQWGEETDSNTSYERPGSVSRESPQTVQNRYGSHADTRYGDDRAQQSPIPRSTSWNQQHIPEREQPERSTISMKKSITIDSLQPRSSFSESEQGESVASLDDKVNSYLEMKGFKPKPPVETSEPVQRRPQRNRAKFTNRESYVYRDSTPSPQHSTQSYEPVQRSSPRPASIDFPPPPPEMLDFPPPPPLEYTTAEIVHSKHPTSVVSSTAYDKEDPPGQVNSNTTQTEERYEEPPRGRDFNRINLQLRQQTEERVNSYPSSDAEDEESSSNYSYDQSSPERRYLQKKYAGIPRSPVIDFKDFLENGEEQHNKADDIKFQRYPVREDEQKGMSREDSFVSSTSGSAMGFPLHRTEEVWSITQQSDAPSSEYQIFEAPSEPDAKQSPELRAPSERKKERKQAQKGLSMKDLQGRTQNVINRHSRENLSSIDRRGELDYSGSSPTLTPSESGTETEDSPREWRRQQQDLAEREQKYWHQEEERARRDEDERAAKVAAVKERRDSEKRAWMEEQERIERMQREYEERQRLEEDRRRLLELKKREDQRKAEEDARQAEEQARREVEEKLRRQAEERARQEAEMKAQQEAEEQAKWESQERARREAEIKARMEAEERAQREMEEARREAEERARREAELRARKEAEERAQREAELRARREVEERARREARERAIREAEEEAQREAAIRGRIEAEERARREAEERARREAQERVRQEAEERAQREAEERAYQQAEERSRREAQERARQEAEERAQREAEERAYQEAEERARREAQERARQEAEERAQQEAEERAHREAEERARREAEERARREEERARREAEERAYREERARREAEERAFREAQEKRKREEEERARKEAEAAEIRARLEHEDMIRREVAAQAERELEMAQKAAEEQMKKEEDLKTKLEADKQAEMEAKKMWEAAEKSVKEAEERARRASLNRQKKEQEADQRISPQRERARSDTEEVSARKPPIPAPRRRNQSEAPDEQTTSLKRGARDRMSLRELKEFTRGTIQRLSSRSLASYASEPPPDLRSDIDVRLPDNIGGGGRLRKKVPSLKDLKTQTRDQIIRHSRDSLSYRRSHSSLSSPGPFSGDDDDDDYYVPFNDYDSDEDNSLRQKVPPCMRPHRRKGPGIKSADPLQRRSFHEMPQDGLSSDLPPVRVTIPMRGAKSTEAIVQKGKKKNMTVEVTLVPRASIENLDKFKPEVKVTNNPMEYKKLTGSMPELSDDGSEQKTPSGLRGSRSNSDYGVGRGRGSKITSGDTGYSSVTSDDSPDNIPSRPRSRSWKGSVSLDTEGMDDLLVEEKENDKKEVKSPKSPKSPKSKSKKKSGTFPRFKQDQKQERPRSRVEILLHGIGNEDPKAPYYETEV